VSRRFYPASIRPDFSAARPDASRYLTSLRFFPSSDKGKIDQPSDARTTNMEIADSTSTIRTTASHGPDARIADMKIAC
jgi:hypothetical protein